MLISDWSSDVCSSDLTALDCFASLAMTKNVLDERPALLRRLHIHRCLHTLVERLARRTDALGVGRGRPVAVRRDHQLALRKIGRASCRERVCQYAYISVVAVSLKTKQNTIQQQ